MLFPLGGAREATDEDRDYQGQFQPELSIRLCANINVRDMIFLLPEIISNFFLDFALSLSTIRLCCNGGQGSCFEFIGEAL